MSCNQIKEDKLCNDKQNILLLKIGSSYQLIINIVETLTSLFQPIGTDFLETKLKKLSVMSYLCNVDDSEPYKLYLPFFYQSINQKVQILNLQPSSFLNLNYMINSLNQNMQYSAGYLNIEI